MAISLLNDAVSHSYYLAWLAAKTIAEYVDKDSNGVQQGHGALVQDTNPIEN